MARLDRAVAESRIDAPGTDPWRDTGANPYWVRPGRALDLYLEAGRSGDALDLARDLFHSNPRPTTLDFLLATAERLGRREEELDSVLAWSTAGTGAPGTRPSPSPCTWATSTAPGRRRTAGASISPG